MDETSRAAAFLRGSDLRRLDGIPSHSFAFLREAAFILFIHAIVGGSSAGMPPSIRPYAARIHEKRFHNLAPPPAEIANHCDRNPIVVF
ncbi:hypothetical protein GZH47_19790 [Paenibacillus rhizovicinus]|uniref:Uncharacterized protein n=1 Tax=Paenibacillus rhizovicinus TaxID=2704463 RepID=A0A6C0P2Y0_9BACL|nr:hypothetical protein [Paenibacillus rhizovicinus]QHW32829.1 hypothetical protein GZH47_19790 [Paenibacillus rhizovicinus]